MQPFLNSLIARFSAVLRPDVVALLTGDIGAYTRAFTVDDYEVFEQIGDVVIGQFIVAHSYRSFPFLATKDGVKIVARIRIKYTSCAVLAAIAEDLEFWPRIAAENKGALDEPMTPTKKQALLEDVFEAFIGATNYIVDQKYGPGTGYIVCHAILKQLYDAVEIDLRYESLFDAKTRLKELCDFFKSRLSIHWTSIGACAVGQKISLTYTIDGVKQTIYASARTKIDAEQSAAQEVIQLLNKHGIKKEAPEIFSCLARETH